MLQHHPQCKPLPPPQPALPKCWRDCRRCGGELVGVGGLIGLFYWVFAILPNTKKKMGVIQQ